MGFGPANQIFGEIGGPIILLGLEQDQSIEMGLDGTGLPVVEVVVECAVSDVELEVREKERFHEIKCIENIESFFFARERASS